MSVRAGEKELPAGDDSSKIMASYLTTRLTKGAAMSTRTSPPKPSISISRDIPAPAEQIFSVLARPAAHPDVDGSGMLRTAVEDVAISKVGDVFTMNMCNGEMGDYVIENRVVEYEPERRIAWEPVMHSVDKPEFQSDIGEPGHHRWGW